MSQQETVTHFPPSKQALTSFRHTNVCASQIPNHHLPAQQDKGYKLSWNKTDKQDKTLSSCRKNNPNICTLPTCRSFCSFPRTCCSFSSPGWEEKPFAGWTHFDLQLETSRAFQETRTDSYFWECKKRNKWNSSHKMPSVMLIRFWLQSNGSRSHVFFSFFNFQFTICMITLGSFSILKMQWGFPYGKYTHRQKNGCGRCQSLLSINICNSLLMNIFVQKQKRQTPLYARKKGSFWKLDPFSRF